MDFKATMLNINLGYNKELMEKCQRLREYAQLINLIRMHIAEGKSVESATTIAVDECIEQGILTDILSKNKTEVFELILTEYNEQNHIANEKKISRDEGQLLKLISLVQKKYAKGQTLNQIAEDLLENTTVIQPIYDLIEQNPDKSAEEILNLLS